MSIYILPVLFIFIFIYARIKKVNTYQSFINGTKGAIPLVIDIFPYLVAIIMMVQIMRVSGLSGLLSTGLAPIFGFMGIPKELVELVLLKPFSGSGALALLSDIYTQYGTDSFVGRAASVIISSSDTVFYISTLYFSGTSIKKLSYAIPVALLASLAAVVVSCLICRVM
ncbi:MAG: spore maturation protein [Christensenellaceae bacterium]|jgi:spore maturation protein B|nr:spore maturation protein [Christensenellaceae bacterium]